MSNRLDDSVPPGPQNREWLRSGLDRIYVAAPNHSGRGTVGSKISGPWAQA